MLCIHNPGSGKGSFTSTAEKTSARNMDSWVWLCYDQLNLELLRGVSSQPSNTGLILIESSIKGKSHPYHKQKLAFLLSNMRHFAVEAVNQGYEVQYIITEQSYHDALRHLHSTLGQIHAIEHAERSTRLEVQPLVDDGLLLLLPHSGWLTTEALFTDSVGNQPPFRMDAFYRNVRRKTGWLMHEGKPIGGNLVTMVRIGNHGKVIRYPPLHHNLHSIILTKKSPFLSTAFSQTTPALRICPQSPHHNSMWKKR